MERKLEENMKYWVYKISQKNTIFIVQGKNNRSNFGKQNDKKMYRL